MSSSSSRSALGRSLGRRPVEEGPHLPGVEPSGKLGRGAVLELFVDGEELLDLGAEVAGQVLEPVRAGECRVADRDADQLRFWLAVRGADEQRADDPGRDLDPPIGGFVEQHRRVEGVAVSTRSGPTVPGRTPAIVAAPEQDLGVAADVPGMKP